MITREFASHIVEEWIALWNRHDLEHSLSHYTDLVQMSSLSIAQIARELLTSSDSFIVGGVLIAKLTVRAVYRPVGRQHYMRSYSVRTNCGSYARSSLRTMK